MHKYYLLLLFLFFSLGNANSQERLKSNGEIPVLAWYSIPASETTVERYQEMKDAGITHSLSFFSNIDDLQKALDVAAKVGMKMLVTCPELKKEPEKTVKRFINHPAVAGYHLIDEPNIRLFPELSAWAKKIQSVDDKHFCYVNLFPNFADSTQLGTKSYKEYVQEYIRQIPLQFVSFDYYPVMKDRLSKSWYENLELISAESKNAGLPFWAFALTTNYDNDHVTPQTLAAMRLQVFSNLAYGAQGIQYFTYWSATSVNSPSGEDQRGAPISATGKRSVVYDRVKQMSAEIKSLSGVFLGSKVVSVRHADIGKIPAGTIRLTSLPKAIKVLDSKGAPIIVSVLEKGENSFLVVVNKDFLNSINLTVYGDESVKRVLKDGTIVPASAYESSMELDAGDAAIFMFPTANR
ncbi:MAG: beta-galactosidase [Prolixibacteraceae bacterium]|nr:beta-galactosidase [Prolixibacteraceae bacterium]